MVEKSKRAKKVPYCNPAVRSAKYAADLHKKKDTFSGNELRDTQASFRAGYLQAQRDSAEAQRRSKDYYKDKDKATVRSEKAKFKKGREERRKNALNGNVKANKR